jgi:hypothetical protein
MDILRLGFFFFQSIICGNKVVSSQPIIKELLDILTKLYKIWVQRQGSRSAGFILAGAI